MNVTTMEMSAMPKMAERALFWCVLSYLLASEDHSSAHPVTHSASAVAVRPVRMAWCFVNVSRTGLARWLP